MTKLPHYVLPLYPAIAILIAGILEPSGLSTNRWLVRGTAGWFAFPAVIAIGVVVVFIVIGHDLGFVAWPFAAAAAIVGLFAWWLYEVDGAERSLLRGMVASVLIAVTVYAVTFPSLPALFPSALVADALRAGECGSPHVASTGYYQEPSLVFLLGTDTRFTDGAGAAEFLSQGRVPLCAGRRAQRAQLRAAGGCDRVALRAQPARRRLQHQHRAAGDAHRIPLGGNAMTAANGFNRRRSRRGGFGAAALRRQCRRGVRRAGASGAHDRAQSVAVDAATTRDRGRDCRAGFFVGAACGGRAQRSARLRVCRAGWSGFSIRSRISASRAGSCGRLAFCF